MTLAKNIHSSAAKREGARLKVAVSGDGHGLRMVVHTGQLAGEAKGALANKPRAVLTERELQVLRLIAEGRHNRQIAARIHRSIKTVEKHRQKLHLKLSTHEVAGLTRQALAMGLLDEPRRAARALAKAEKRLTKRELEVLKLVAQGSGNKWIADTLRRSVKTVDHHRENIMKKLGIHDVAGLTRHALALGLL